jgi:hypothetical protein
VAFSVFSCNNYSQSRINHRAERAGAPQISKKKKKAYHNFQQNGGLQFYGRYFHPKFNDLYQNLMTYISSKRRGALESTDLNFIQTELEEKHKSEKRFNTN